MEKLPRAVTFCCPLVRLRCSVWFSPSHTVITFPGSLKCRGNTQVRFLPGQERTAAVLTLLTLDIMLSVAAFSKEEGAQRGSRTWKNNWISVVAHPAGTKTPFNFQYHCEYFPKHGRKKRQLHEVDDNFTYKFKNVFWKINNNILIVPIQPKKTFWLLFFKIQK